MTPSAAYYIFTAGEHERAAAAARGLDVGPRQRSFLGRLRALAATLRGDRSFAQPA